jgi:hypothetical protein
MRCPYWFFIGSGRGYYPACYLVFVLAKITGFYRRRNLKTEVGFDNKSLAGGKDLGRGLAG